MFRATIVITASFSMLCGLPATAQTPETPDAAELARVFRTLLIASIPNPLVEQSYNWGHQESVPVGLKWEKKGIILRPEVLKKLHNEGVWRKIGASADHPERTLELHVKDIRIPEAGKLAFTIELGLP